MTAKHLLRFIKKKLKKNSSDVVVLRDADGENVTLGEVFKKLGVDAKDLSVDRLNVTADPSTMHRFDNFNAKYSPLGESVLRTIFLKTDNDQNGQYLAELTQELFSDLEESKYTHTEYRISIYGRSKSEWSKLARWILSNNL